MSLYLNVTVHAPQEQMPDLAETLFDQLLKHGRLFHYMIHTGYQDEERYFQSKSARTELYFSKEQLHAIAREILLSDSNKALWIEMNYDLVTGFSFPIDMLICGSLYSGGDLALLEGPIMLTVEYEGMSRSLSEIYAEQHGNFASNQDLSNASERTLQQLRERFHGEVTENVSELFFLACGVEKSDGRCGDFEHGAVGGGVIASSPAFHSAIFHKDPSEFARDFIRIYLEYHVGIAMPMTLGRDVDLWKLEPPKRSGRQGTLAPGKADTSRYQSYLSHETRSALRFLEDLTRSKVDELSRLAGDELRIALRQMNRRHDTPPIEVHDFGECGLALITNPREALWPAYKYISDYFS